MFVGSPMSSKPTSPVPAHSPLVQMDPEAPDDPDPATLRVSALPCWATQALCDLTWAETELCRLRERQAVETEIVKRGVERAILGARREERRLLERVEQDHRDAQQHLEQVLRENTAATRVSQSLLDERLRKLAKLREQIQRTSQWLSENRSGPDQNLLLNGVMELLQPWEISLSLKKVSFKPSSQPNAITFGDIRVQEHSLCLPGGGCGPQGQLCALHSGDMHCRDVTLQDAGEERSTPDGAGPGQAVVTSSTGRVVRKIRLSARSDEELREELKLTSLKLRRWLPKREQSDRESSQDDEMESPTSEPTRGDLFLAVPATLNYGDSESEERGYSMGKNARHYSPRNPRKPRTLAPVSGSESSPSPEQGKHIKLSQCWSLDSQDRDRGRAKQDSKTRQDSRQDSSSSIFRHCYGTLTSPKMTPRETLASQSCLDLTSRGQCHSRLSQSSDEHPMGTTGDSGRALSPADSLDSCYTFIVSSPRDCSANRGSLKHNTRLSKSAADLTQRTRPLISGVRNKHMGVWRVNQRRLTSPSPTLSRGSRVSNIGQSLPCTAHRNTNVQQILQKRTAMGDAIRVARSLSMVIDTSSQEPSRDRGDRGEPALVEMEEEGDMSLFSAGDSLLIRQFGKQGSGRADLTLPSGIHVTPQGQLFIVDCGNARVQVTDPQGNVLQQVTTSTPNSSARRCRNYFDIAVNTKGLIALSCAAERALLVFSRHGRLLQTFGGSGLGIAKDELEAPRGVTVTRLDEFLVADIRKGTLIALKLEPKTGSRLERTVVTGFHRPYLVAACLSSGMVAVSERGSETGREPCVKVLEPGWNTVRVLGVCSSMGPVLTCPWGICIDGDGDVLVADWGEQHRVVIYPAEGVGQPLITQDLSSPRGLALLSEGQLVVSDSMHHCIKIYQYK